MHPLYAPTTYHEMRHALESVRRRTAVDPGSDRSKAEQYADTAEQLWSAEYDSYRALHALGHYSAAECAWKRRTVYSDLTTMLLDSQV